MSTRSSATRRRRPRRTLQRARTLNRRPISFGTCLGSLSRSAYTKLAPIASVCFWLWSPPNLSCASSDRFRLPFARALSAHSDFSYTHSPYLSRTKEPGKACPCRECVRPLSRESRRYI